MVNVSPFLTFGIERDDMARKPLSMRKIREIIRLGGSGDLSGRQIASSCRVSPTTASKVLKAAEEADLLKWPLPELTEVELRERLFGPAGAMEPLKPLPDMKEMVNRQLSTHADILCLATAIVSHRDHGLARFFKVPIDSDGWFLEAHQKLRPVDFANDGVFLCGMAHYPKPMDESIAQAQAAAARALTVLSMETIQVGGIVCSIDAALCSACLACINVCPYGAISFNPDKGAAEINEALCKGCGACAATCPSEAAVLMGFNNKELYAQIRGALAA